MATIVLAHGAWSAAFAWRRMRPLMVASGHVFLTPTYTGLGVHAALASLDVDLETHINDVLRVFYYEDLRDVVLLGHSYGGIVATGVADRARSQVARLIYLDAFVPKDGECLNDLVPPGQSTKTRKIADETGGWVPPNPTPADTSPEDAAWLLERRASMPLKCFDQKLVLQNGELTLPRSYIRAMKYTNGPFGQFADRAKTEPGWTYHEIDSSHSPNVTAPEALMQLLNEIIAVPQSSSLVGVARLRSR